MQNKTQRQFAVFTHSKNTKRTQDRAWIKVLSPPPSHFPVPNSSPERFWDKGKDGERTRDGRGMEGLPREGARGPLPVSSRPYSMGYCGVEAVAGAVPAYQASIQAGNCSTEVRGPFLLKVLNGGFAS